MSDASATATAVPEWDVADRVRKALRVSGVGVQEIADYLDVDRSTVSTWINGRITPSTQTLRLVALRCGVPYEWLRDGTTASGPDTPDDQGITRRRWNGSRVVALNTRRPRPTMSTERPAA